MPEEREAIMQELGKKIRQKREELGLSLKDVHEGTKIRTQFLEGIERGDYSNFPGNVYIRGFIRTYLQYIGVNELWNDFLPILSEEGEKSCSEETVVGSCTPPAKGFKPASRFWIFVILLLVVMGSSWYVWFSWDQKGAPSFTVRKEQEVKTGEAEESPAKNSVPFGDAGSKLEEKSVETKGKEEVNNGSPLPDENSVGSREVLLSPDQTSSVPPPGIILPPTAAELVGTSVPPSPPPVPERAKDKELVISADGDCWVRVRQGTKTLFEKTLKAGDTVSFTVQERTEVTYGRAGAVNTHWNGDNLGNPGTSKGVERMFYAPDGSTGRIRR